MREASLPSFTKVTECPQCGAPLKVTNTPARVARECSEDWRHYLVETPVPPERKHMVLVTRPKAAVAVQADVSEIRHQKNDSSDTPDELTYEPDDTELAERAAIQAEALGIEFDDEGEIARIPPGIDDETYCQSWLALRAGEPYDR